jgi:hypothetical protein
MPKYLSRGVNGRVSKIIDMPKSSDSILSMLGNCIPKLFSRNGASKIIQTYIGKAIAKNLKNLILIVL